MIVSSQTLVSKHNIFFSKIRRYRLITFSNSASFIIYFSEEKETTKILDKHSFSY